MRRWVEGGEGHCAQQAACILRARQRGRAFWRRWRASRGAYPSDRKNCCGAKLELAQRANGRLSSGSACDDLAATDGRVCSRMSVDQLATPHKAEMGACLSYLPYSEVACVESGGLGPTWVWSRGTHPPRIIGEMNTCCACATTTLNRTLTAVSKAARRRCVRHMHTAGRRCRTDTVARSA